MKEIQHDLAISKKIAASSPFRKTSTRLLQGANGQDPDLLISLRELKAVVAHPPKLPPKLHRLAKRLSNLTVDIKGDRNRDVNYKGPIKIHNPELVVLAAAVTATPLPIALALLTDESEGGKNHWGQDGGQNFQNGVDETSGRDWGKEVTKDAYLAYRKQATPDNQQGVGPTQLTDLSFQRDADDLGGAWKPLPNLLVGFDHAAKALWSDPNGLHAALNKYNAGHDIAPSKGDYADRILVYAKQWSHAIGVPYSPSLWSR